jgi:hypothetical protein
MLTFIIILGIAGFLIITVCHLGDYPRKTGSK